MTADKTATTKAKETSADLGKKVQAMGKFESLPGLEKAATVLLILGEERSGQILELMDQSELINVTRAMSAIGKIPQETVKQACRVFTSKMAEGEVMVGSAYTAERMLLKFLPEDRVSSIMNEIKAPAGRTTWEKLSSINHVALANFLVGEGAQTAAVVLSRLKPDYAAKMFETFPPDFTTNVVKRLIDLDPVSHDSVKEIEEILQGEFMSNYHGVGSDPTGFLAEIFNRTKTDLTDDILTNVGNDRPNEVAKIQSRMFTFDDLAGIDITAASAIMTAVEKDIMHLALKGANEQVKERFLSAVSERVSNIMRDEMQTMGAQRFRDVKAAQDDVLRVAKRLEAEGAIILRTESEDDRLIE